MTRAAIVGGFASALVLALIALGVRHHEPRRGMERVASSAVAEAAQRGADQGLLYGRVTMDDGTTHEGRVRWGVDEEALWSNSFNGFKDENAWAALVPRDRLPTARVSIGAFGIELATWEHRIDLGRPFMARFGDIVRIEPDGRDIRVVLKSGTVAVLDRYASDDLADGLRVWGRSGGVLDLGERRIRSIEFLPTPRIGAGTTPLYGTVHARHGDFTGLVQWDREACVDTDELGGHTADGGDLSVRFGALRSITRRSHDSSLLTLLDGREVVLSGTRRVGDGNRGVYVDDARYGRVLVSWDAFERVDFVAGGTAPAYGDFPEGRPLTGRVVTRSGLQVAGRLVFDLDESETTETLDAPLEGVDYSIPFGWVTSILLPRLDGQAVPHASVTLHGGETLHLERTGDLGRDNAGVLIFVDGGRDPEYVPWSEVVRVDFDGPAAGYPTGAAR